MKKYYFLIIVTLIFGLALTGCSVLSNVGQVPTSEQSGMTYVTKGGTEAEPVSFPLYAGQDWEVGEVLVWNDEEELCVRYELSGEALEEGWLIYETHIAVGADAGDIPQTKHKKNEVYGNPKVGNFPYGKDDLGGVEFYEECEIPIPVACGNTFVIAAHAVVKKLGGLEGLELILPDQAWLCIDSQPGPNGYFGATISDGTVLDGFYDGYCIDTGSYIDDTFCGWVNIYSSYEGLPTGLVDYLENLNLVNYIMNQDYTDKTSDCDGAYTPGDVQWAIWQLVDDNPSAGGWPGSWMLCRANEILADAYDNGKDYEPGCGEKAVVLLVPTDESQPIIIMVDVPCEGDETAWGAFDVGETRFVEKGNWATYFTYEIACL